MGARTEWALLTAERDGMPAIIVVDRSVGELRMTGVFEWHLSVIFDFKEVAEKGMPTADEQEILLAEEEDLEERLCGSDNATLLARVTWNSTRRLIYRVTDPEAAAAMLGEKVEMSKFQRDFEFRMEHDVEWEHAEYFLNAGLEETSQAS